MIFPSGCTDLKTHTVYLCKGSPKDMELKPGFIELTLNCPCPSFKLTSALSSAANPLPAPYRLVHPPSASQATGRTGRLEGHLRTGLPLLLLLALQGPPSGCLRAPGKPYWAGGYSPAGPVPAAQPGLVPTVQGADCATGAHPGAHQPVSQD